MRRLISGLTAMGTLVLLLPGVAGARPGYKNTFVALYSVKPDSNLGKAGCGLCHMGPDKKNRNAYGKDLEKAPGKTMASDDETKEALKKIEEMKAPDKKTKYLELIKADKLPGDEPKKEEPK